MKLSLAEERLVDLEAKDVRGYLALIKSPNLDSTVCSLGS